MINNFNYKDFENLRNLFYGSDDPLDELMNSMDEYEIKKLRKKIDDGMNKLFMEE